MAFLDNTKKTRFKITVIVIFFNMIVSLWSLAIKETEVTIIALGVIAASGVMYKHSEGTRPSSKKVDLLNSEEG